MALEHPEETESGFPTTPEEVISRLSLRQQEEIEGWLFVTLKVGIILFALGFPIVFAVYLSFTQSNLLNLPGQFVGLDNYFWLLNYEVWWRSVINVLIMGAVLLPTNILFSFTAALFLEEKIRGRNLYRVAYLVPVAGPPLIWAIVWKFVLFPDNAGFLNALLASTGLIDQAIPWLTNQSYALTSVITTQIWGFGISMLIYMAALAGLPKTVIESSMMDGAGRFDRVRYIIWPLLKPTTFFLVVVQLISIMRIGFGAVYILTQGGPVNSTQVPSYFIYALAFEFNSFGRSAAASVAMFLLTVVITLLLWKPLQSRSQYYQ